jgi:hypothetical protein
MQTDVSRIPEGVKIQAEPKDGAVSPSRAVGTNAGTALQARPPVWQRHFWVLACGLISVWVFIRVCDFTLIPPAVNGMYLTQPFYGLHSWELANRAWAARNHIKYGLSYTKGLRTPVVGGIPPAHPPYYVSHPPLETWLLALGMLAFGAEEWSVRLTDTVVSAFCLPLILLLLRKLHGAALALLSGLVLVLLPLSAYFNCSPLMILLSLWALYQYLGVTGRWADASTPGRRRLLGLGMALFLLPQVNWVGAFYDLVIGLHYVQTCVRRRQVRAMTLAAIALPSLLSVMLNLSIMMYGMRHNMMVEQSKGQSASLSGDKPDTPWSRMMTLYTWRARNGERDSFSWAAWIGTNMEHAGTNFTLPVLLFLGIYVLYLLPCPSRITNAPASGLHELAPPIRWLASPGPFAHAWFYLLPAVSFLFVFKGLFWAHQYWQSPFALFVSIGSASGVLLIRDACRRANRWFGRSVVVVVLAVFAVFCRDGLASYRAVRWHSPNTIGLLQELNQRIPPDKALLTFNDFMIQQSQAKVAFYRPEYAWYLDHEMIVANAWTYRSSREMISASIDDVVKRTIREIQEQAATGRFSFYHIPADEESSPDALDRVQQAQNTAGAHSDDEAEQTRENASSLAGDRDGKWAAALCTEEIELRLRENNNKDGSILLREKHRRYRRAVIVQLRDVYPYEYCGQSVDQNSRAFDQDGVIPCYLFDLRHPK